MDVDTRCTKCRLCIPIGYAKETVGNRSRMEGEKFTRLFVCAKGESENYGLVFLHYHRICGVFEPKK